MMSKEFIEAEMKLFAEQAEEVDAHYHHGHDSPEKIALADYRRYGQEHEAVVIVGGC